MKVTDLAFFITPTIQLAFVTPPQVTLSIVSWQFHQSYGMINIVLTVDFHIIKPLKFIQNLFMMGGIRSIYTSNKFVCCPPPQAKLIGPSILIPGRNRVNQNLKSSS